MPTNWSITVPTPAPIWDGHGRINPDGTITCLAHRFCFDLRTGECLNAKGYRLKVEERERDPAPNA